MKQKTRRTTEKQATEDNQNVKEKKPNTTGHGNTQENTRHPQLEFPTQVRSPEENNKQNTKEHAEEGTNKIFQERGSSQGRPGEGENWTGREERTNNQGQHTTNTSKETTDTHQKRASKGRKNIGRETIKAVKPRAKGSDVTWKKKILRRRFKNRAITKGTRCRHSNYSNPQE